MRPIAALCLAVLLVLASSGVAATASPTARTPTETSTPVEERDEHADPDEDVIGWENGYWHNESIDVDNSDGLNYSELQAVRDRTMARVEYIRQKEFESTPQIKFTSRRAYQERHSSRQTPSQDPNPRAAQFWEAAFVIDEETHTDTVRDQFFGVVVDGFYIHSTITFIVNDTESPQVDPLVFAHELTHALASQTDAGDQMDDRPGYRDWIAGSVAVSEGEATWVESRYQRLCDQKWECIERPEEGYDAVPDDSVNMGLYLDFAARYTLGESFVQRQYERNGLEGVNRVLKHRPQSSEQVVHPEKYATDPPTNVTVTDRSSNDWKRMEADEWEYPKKYNFGEVGLYVMLWYNGLIDTKSVNVTVGQQTGLNYSHPATAGWDGDVVVPYRNEAEYNEFGYVFKSVWDSGEDAREFHETYLELLDERGAEQVRENVYRIPDGPYADAFRVVRENDTLLVVNAPTVDSLSDVHGDADATTSNESTATSRTESTTISPTEGALTTDADTDIPSPVETDSPGFGLVATVIALLGATVLLRRN